VDNVLATCGLAVVRLWVTPSFPVDNLWAKPGTVHPSSTVYPTVYVQDTNSLYITDCNPIESAQILSSI
jgi:hypothetical protein